MNSPRSRLEDDASGVCRECSGLGCLHCCEHCAAATGGRCREHALPECVCYELHSDYLCGYRPPRPITRER